MNRLEFAICTAVLVFGGALALYGNHQLHRAFLQRVAACQTISDPQLWKDFECLKAFRQAEEAQR